MIEAVTMETSLVPRGLSHDVDLRAKDGGKKKAGVTLALRHQSLAFVQRATRTPEETYDVTHPDALSDRSPGFALSGPK